MAQAVRRREDEGGAARDAIALPLVPTRPHLDRLPTLLALEAGVQPQPKQAANGAVAASLCGGWVEHVVSTCQLPTCLHPHPLSHTQPPHAHPPTWVAQVVAQAGEQAGPALLGVLLHEPPLPPLLRKLGVPPPQRHDELHGRHRHRRALQARKEGAQGERQAAVGVWEARRGGGRQLGG